MPEHCRVFCYESMVRLKAIKNWLSSEEVDMTVIKGKTGKVKSMQFKPMRPVVIPNSVDASPLQGYPQHL